MIDVCANNTNVLDSMYSYVVGVLIILHVCQVYVFLLSTIGLATHGILPFKNSSLNLAFPVKKYKTFNTILQGMVMNKLDFVVASWCCVL